MPIPSDLWTRVAGNLSDWQRFFGPVLILVAAILAAIVLHRIAYRAALSYFEGRLGMGAELLRRAKRPTRLVAVLIALMLTAPHLTLPTPVVATLEHATLFLAIVLTGWTVILLTNHFSERSMRRYRLDTEDNLAARKHVTQVRVLRRSITTVIVLVTAGAALMTFESVQRYGVSLFASAGAAGLILGLAARPVLANLIAGIQIAITQPIRLEDVVIIEGEWGWIEEIFATYVVVRLWDWRRMVVPLSYFIEQPFQNWTREQASVIGSVYWYLDYTLPIEEMRAKMERAIEASPYWDGKVKVLQVVDTDKDTMHLRGLMSTRTAPQNWDMRCEIREKIVTWVQAEYPDALPRLRGQFEMLPPSGHRGAPEASPPRGGGGPEQGEA